ncbi:MAG TPA: sugar phosphate isomerase/epimerase, partial [Devosia sp.]
MKTIKGPAIFLAQFAGDKAPFDTLDNICKWAADLGYKGVQIPTWASHFIDVEKAATSKAYADDLNG